MKKLNFPQVIAGARTIHAHSVVGTKPDVAELNEKIQSATAKYSALSDAAKKDLQEHSPIIASIFKSEFVSWALKPCECQSQYYSCR